MMIRDLSEVRREKDKAIHLLKKHEERWQSDATEEGRKTGWVNVLDYGGI